jgi:hypothetical protein
MPLRLWPLRSEKEIPEPATRSLTVLVASTLSGSRQRGNARTDVHGDTAVIVTANLALTSVHTGAHVDPSRPRRFDDPLRATDRPCRSIERCEETVACRADLTTTKQLELCAHHFVVTIKLLTPVSIAEGRDSLGGRTMSVNITVARTLSLTGAGNELLDDCRSLGRLPTGVRVPSREGRETSVTPEEMSSVCRRSH